MSVTLKKSTPVLVVERIEPALAFWKKLGVEKVVDVSEGDHMGFAILAGQGIEVMYQTSESVNSDLVASSATRGAFKQAPQQGYLFLEVASIQEVAKALADEKLILPLRKTSYGATELGYLDRAGNVIVLAEMAG
ncbi:MAG: hypothetical protein QM704_18990 [Anaeromyxobacteraceae bacterium]